jgi:hypothetical protein
MCSLPFSSDYAKLPSASQARVLVQLIHELTLSMRGCYSAKPQVVNSNPGSMVGAINELQHRIVGHVADLLAGKPQQASPHQVIAAIRHDAKSLGLQREIDRLLPEAISRVSSWP